MKRKTEQFMHPSEELRKLPHKSVCYDDSLLRLNNNKKYKEGVKEFKKCDNKKIPGLVSPHLPKLHLNFSYNYVAVTFTKLLRIYYFFILPFMATMVLGNNATVNGTVESDGNEASGGMQTDGEPTSPITDAISRLCELIPGTQKYCKRTDIIGPIAFFLISTIISIILGLIRRCCCGIGRSRRRRKRNAQMNEMDEEQMLQAQLLQQQMQQQQLQQLQMQQMLQMGQQLPFVGMLQETPIPDEGKKKKKKSKKQQDDSMNPFYLGYQPVVQ